MISRTHLHSVRLGNRVLTFINNVSMTTPTEFTCLKEADLESVVEHVLALVDPHRSSAAVVALSGDLGAGKTAFVRALATHLGVETPVTSPTFTIMSQYEVDRPSAERLVHIDAYRIESLDEVGPLRLDTVLADPTAIVCIEWPERIAAVLPKQSITVSMAIGPNESRSISVTLAE